jgi:iron complex transport system substrate-binding protein
MAGMSKKPGVIGLLAVLLAVFFASCAGAAENPTPSSAAPLTPAPLTLTDQLGRTVTIKTTPQRIVSMAPSNTEIVYALGLEDRLVAVTDFDDYPPQAKDKPSIGGFSTPNIEQIVAMAPDLVLAASIHEGTIIPKLEDRGLTVLALAPKTIDEVLAAITLVGKATGAEKEAAALTSEMQQRVDAITDKTRDLPPGDIPEVFYVLWQDPLMTVGTNTLQDQLINLAGSRNIGRVVTDYADISLEDVVAANPEVIIAATSHGSGEDQTFTYVRDEPRLRDTAAVRNGRLYAVDGNLTSRPGPRIVDGLEWLASFIHPELFGPPQE